MDKAASKSAFAYFLKKINASCLPLLANWWISVEPFSFEIERAVLHSTGKFLKSIFKTFSFFASDAIESGVLLSLFYVVKAVLN
jgi:hypothetical protein